MRHIRLWGLIALGAALLFMTGSADAGRGRSPGRSGPSPGARPSVSAARPNVSARPYNPGAASSSRTAQTVVGPRGNVGTQGSRQGSYTTQRGTTVDYAGVGRTATTPGGVDAARGVGAVQVTGPNGREYNKLGATRGVQGPNGNFAAQKGSVAVGQGPNGTAASANRSGLAVGPNGAVVNNARIGAATGPNGTLRGASRTGIATGPNGLAAYTGRAATTGHRTAYVAAGSIRNQGVYVRNSFAHYDCFHSNWYVAHPGAWRAAAWTAAAFWVGTSWGTVSSYCGYPAEPAPYDYGSTVVYEGDQILYNGEPVATAEAYADKAAAIAEEGEKAQPSEKEEWISLGVFGMVKGEETEANQIFQLAINKDGILRGNYYDALSDSTLPIHGAVDKKTERAAWTVGDRKETVYETGVGNLTEDETTMLVHFGKDRTQQWTLIRLEQPEEGK